MKHVEAPKTIEPWRIICAAQSEPDYSEYRSILIYGGERPYEDSYILLTGGHCSCYGWEEVGWGAVEYTKGEVMKLAEANITDCHDLYERRFWNMVLMAVGIDG